MKGKLVRVPRGTPVFSTQPGRRHQVSKRDIVVRVHHMLPAWKHLLACRYGVGSDAPRLRFEGNARDQRNLCEALGLPCGNEAEVQTSLESLVSKATVESPYEHGKIECLWIERQPEKVCWAGSGGYWREAPVSAVIPLEDP